MKAKHYYRRYELYTKLHRRSTRRFVSSPAQNNKDDTHANCMRSNECYLAPGDILHSVYSEWLGWKDVSRLDVACVGKSDREVWLTSLTDLKMFNALGINRVSGGKLRFYYIWLKSRRVFCVEDFPVSVNVLQDLVGGLDMESYCPALRSIIISRWYGNESNPDVDEVKGNLSDFLSHCHSLQGVTIAMSDDNRYFNVVLEVLVEKLRENSLIKIALWHVLKGLESQVMLQTLVTKHASSLRDLNLSAMRMDLLVSVLIKNNIHLSALFVCIDDDPSQMTASLISYLSSAGDLLESLKVRWGHGLYNIDDFMVSVATLCAKLTCLDFYGGITCSMQNVCLLYEQCPHLQDVTVYGAVDTNKESSSVSIWVKGTNEDWAVCLSHVLARSQYKKVTLRLAEDCYHPVDNLKSLLKPFEIHVETSEPEAALISLLQDLPRLNSLYLRRFFGKYCTDATLAAITQHARSLTELFMEYDFMGLNSDGFTFSDKQMSELIETCQLLERLTMPCNGLESLVAVSKHSSLRFVNFTMIKSVAEETLDGLLVEEKVKWPSTLKDGYIRSYQQNLLYSVNKESLHWTKRR
eukprot:scaffold2798_cov160-Ochromonas_danica.AAC.22